MRNQWRRLQTKWNETEILWDDKMKRRFEMELWREHNRQIPGFLKDFELSTESILQAYRELGMRI